MVIEGHGAEEDGPPCLRGLRLEPSQKYGVEGVIDIHHVVPLHKIGESVTTMNDLALVCPTCHRMLHKHRPLITPAELRAKQIDDVR